MRWREMLLAVLLIWQGVQVLFTGALGIPGIFLIHVNNIFAPPPGQTAPGSSPANPAAPTAVPEPEPPKPAPAASNLPSASDLQGWVRGEAREFVGGVDKEGNILYRFDVWLDAPDDKKQRIASIDYAFDAPSATPAAQSSSDRASGFRVKFGGLSCAQQVAMTVNFDNGEKREALINGCQVLDRGSR